MDPVSSSQGASSAGGMALAGASQSLIRMRGTVSSDFTASPSREFRYQVKIRFIIRKSIEKCKEIRA
jgi:hypothetical protein